MRLNELFRKRRLAKSLSFAGIERISGVHQKTLSCIETGQTVNPGFFTVLRLAEVLEITTEELTTMEPAGRLSFKPRETTS